MDKSVQERETIWQEFLERWPLDTLSSMSLDEYTSVETGDSFCYWLEKRTEDICSIWGGSSFKFGVYARKDTTEKEGGNGRRFADDYAWMEKYGDTPEAAFISVKAEIIKVAQAASRGDLAAIDDADLGEALRWKIAFLYQNQQNPTIVPILKGDYLNMLLETPEPRLSAAHTRLIADHSDMPLLEYGDLLWSKVQARLHEQATPDKAKAFLDSSSLYHSIKPPTKKMAGYATGSDQQLALTLTGKKAVLYFTPGDWLNDVSDSLTGVKHYSANENRNSNLAANAPALALGNPMVSVTLETMDALTEVCEAYAEASDLEQIVNKNGDDMERTNINTRQALNSILYGPPGTGKTYTTTDMAVKLADPQWYKEQLNKLSDAEFRTALKQRYDELVTSERIVFTTFHQSFSYEDFIEGIRADTNDETAGIEYRIEDGVFKRLCDSADKRILRNEELGEQDISKRQFWKMSLGNTQTMESEDIFNECIENNYVLLGWGGPIDFTGCGTLDEVKQKYLQEMPDVDRKFAFSAVNRFKNKIAKGDIIVVSAGNTRYQAIAEVMSDYEYLDDDERDWFFQSRKVRWLKVYEKPRPVSEIYGKIFSQQTLYKLKPAQLKFDALSGLLAKDNAVAAPEPYVLIIDEINRGNISRIFGELITLLEPDKRKGGADERSVTLPYSKKSFQVPQNVYVIGTMNTADRSLVQLDLALRRRFNFFNMPPRPELLQGIKVHGVDMAEMLDTINQRIEILLDRDHLLGHAYLFALKDITGEEARAQCLGDIFRNNIIPLLQEYFFDDWERIRWLLNDHRKQNTDAQFITQDGNADLQQLFGNNIQDRLSERRFRVNAAALHNPVAYQQIITGSGA